MCTVLLPPGDNPIAVNKYIIYTQYFFNDEELLAPRPTSKLEDHPLSAVRDCLFNILLANLYIGGRYSNRNLRTRHAVVTGTHLTRVKQVTGLKHFEVPILRNIKQYARAQRPKTYSECSPRESAKIA